jgi:hypothetical protein
MPIDALCELPWYRTINIRLMTMISYITDIDHLFALALAATVSPSQTSFLRDFSYTHLAFETLVRVHIPVRFDSTMI